MPDMIFKILAKWREVSRAYGLHHPARFREEV
jgi:hypothetical protein